MGQGWTLLLQLGAVPIYLAYLGGSGYGLISFYLVLQATARIFDLGLGPTLSRELARRSETNQSSSDTRDLVRTVEALYWTVGLALGLLVIVLSPLIASRWLNAELLAAPDVTQALRMMGVLLALQWPLTLYENGLLGLGRQVRLNTIRVCLSSVVTGGGIAVAMMPGTSPADVFSAIAAGSALQVVVTAFALWHALPKATSRAVPRWHLLREISGFAGGMTAITVTALILTQTDRILLSKLLTLEEFGHYNVARTLGSAVAVMAQPAFHAFFPRLSRDVARGDENLTTATYRTGGAILLLLLVPPAVTLVALPGPIVTAWTGDSELATSLIPIIIPLVLGSWINGMMSLPYALQLAHGWTSIALRINLALVSVAVPSIYFATIRFGPVGSAGAWLAMNLLYAALAIPLTHRRLLPASTGSRMLAKSLGALGFAGVVGVTAHLVTPPGLGRIHSALIIATTYGLTLLGCVVLTQSRWLQQAVLNAIRPANKK